MASDADRMRIISQLEAALADLKKITFDSKTEASLSPNLGMMGSLGGLRPSSAAGLASKLEFGESIVESISKIETLTDAQKSEFKDLAMGSLQNQLRGLARGEEVASTVNVAVSGTGTISTD